MSCSSCSAPITGRKVCSLLSKEHRPKMSFVWKICKIIFNCLADSSPWNVFTTQRKNLLAVARFEPEQAAWLPTASSPTLQVHAQVQSSMIDYVRVVFPPWLMIIIEEYKFLKNLSRISWTKFSSKTFSIT